MVDEFHSEDGIEAEIDERRVGVQLIRGHSETLSRDFEQNLFDAGGGSRRRLRPDERLRPDKRRSRRGNRIRRPRGSGFRHKHMLLEPGGIAQHRDAGESDGVEFGAPSLHIEQGRVRQPFRGILKGPPSAEQPKSQRGESLRLRDLVEHQPAAGTKQ